MTISVNQPGFDVLSDALDTLDAGAAVFFRGSISPPWLVSIPAADRVLDLMGAPSRVDAVLMFHAVVRGNPVLELLDSSESLPLSTGDLVLLRLDQPHELGEGQGGPRLSMEGMVAEGGAGQTVVFDAGDDPTSARVICGGFFLRNAALHPLVASLPSVTLVHSAGSFDAVALLLSMLARESDAPGMGSETVVRRLSDLLLVELLRSGIREPRAKGWLCALRDPVLRRALGALHADPAHDWTVPNLARAAGVSESGLNTRFRKVLGESPGRYVTHWRMHLATRLLRDPELGIIEVATAVGYGSAAAFSRTFKRKVGVSPGAWRRAKVDH